MILGIGCDVVNIKRIEEMLEKSGAKFENRIFTEAERVKARSREKAGTKLIAATYAKRFAAKEACAKALGTGLGKDAAWREIEIKNAKNGAPEITLSGSALKKLEIITPKGKQAAIHVSLADDYPYAMAWVLIEAKK